MKWYNAVIGTAFVIVMVIYAGTISGCGNFEVTKTITETVTATPKPSATPTATPSTTPSPYLDADEAAGLVELTGFAADLKHIYKSEVSMMNYGINNGSFAGVVNRAEDWANDWTDFRKRYTRSNGGEMYGGKLSRLENLIENTGEHIRLYGRGLMQVVADPNVSDAALRRAGRHSAYAERGIERIAAEIDRLEAAEGESY